MKFNYYTEVSIIATPKTTAQGVAGSVGVILGGSNGPLGRKYAVHLRDEAEGWGEVWMVDEADLSAGTDLSTPLSHAALIAQRIQEP
jgi:hypothetical protein